MWNGAKWKNTTKIYISKYGINVYARYIRRSITMAEWKIEPSDCKNWIRNKPYGDIKRVNDPIWLTARTDPYGLFVIECRNGRKWQWLNDLYEALHKNQNKRTYDTIVVHDYDIRDDKKGLQGKQGEKRCYELLKLFMNDDYMEDQLTILPNSISIHLHNEKTRRNIMLVIKWKEEEDGTGQGSD